MDKAARLSRDVSGKKTKMIKLKQDFPKRMRDVRGGLIEPFAGQCIFAVIAASIFDMGECGMVVAIGSITHWACVAIIAIRRRNNLQPLDVIAIKGGYLFYTAIAFAALLVWQKLQT